MCRARQCRSSVALQQQVHEYVHKLSAACAQILTHNCPDPEPSVAVQGEMVQSKFGIAAVAARQMEAYTSAVLEATMLPPAPNRSPEWRTIMDSLSQLSCRDYRTVCKRHISVCDGGVQQLGSVVECEAMTCLFCCRN